MRTREEGCCPGANKSTGIGSIVGSSCLLTVDFILTFGLDHGVLTDLEKEIMRNGCSVYFLF